MFDFGTYTSEFGQGWRLPASMNPARTSYVVTLAKRATARPLTKVRYFCPSRKASRPLPDGDGLGVMPRLTLIDTTT